MKGITRKISVIIGLAILIVGLYASSQVGKASRKTPTTNKEEKEDKRTAVFVQKIVNSNQQSTVSLSGKVMASQKIDIFAEVNGQLLNMPKPFREGVRFKKGELMLELDDRDARLELQGQRSQLYSQLVLLLPSIDNDYSDNLEAWTNYIEAFDVEKATPALPETKSKREKLFIASKQVQTLYYGIKRLENRLEKYKIYAPFDGVLSSATTYEGALVRAGQRLGVLSHPSKYELEASVSLYDLEFFRPGAKVELTSDAFDKTWKGVVSRLGKSVDASTQTQKVFIRLSSNQLNEGMFLNGKVQTQEIKNVAKVARNLLINNNQVYVVENETLSLKPVSVVKVDGNDMYIRGLEDGAMLLSKRFLEAYKGMSVRIIE